MGHTLIEVREDGAASWLTMYLGNVSEQKTAFNLYYIPYFSSEMSFYVSLISIAALIQSRAVLRWFYSDPKSTYFFLFYQKHWQI